MNLQDAVLSFEQSQAHLQTKPKLIRGRLGLPNGTILTKRSNYHWVRLWGLNNHIVQAYNIKTSATFNLEVYIAVDQYRSKGAAPYVVMGTTATIGTVMDALLDEKSKAEELIGAHAASHEFSDANVGRDALNVFSRALVPLRVQAQTAADMTVYVNPGYFCYLGNIYLFKGGNSGTIVAPASGTRIDLVYLDCAENAIGITSGGVALTIYDSLTPPDLQINQLPLGYLLIGANTTTLNEQNIWDMRPALTYALPGCIIGYEEPSAKFAGMFWLDTSDEVVLGDARGAPILTATGDFIGL